MEQLLHLEDTGGASDESDVVRDLAAPCWLATAAAGRAPACRRGLRRAGSPQRPQVGRTVARGLAAAAAAGCPSRIFFLFLILLK